MRVIQLGDKRFRILERLGHGTYGTVYRCLDDSEVIMAIKSIPRKKYGLPCLLEASIMSSNNFDFLASATHIGSDNENMYIVSELGTSDLGKWTRVDKMGNIATIDQLRLWSQSLVLSLCGLEKQGLVHGDVKPANILLYPDDNIKLSDFTLATFSGTEIERSYYTYSYRPLEIWAHTLSHEVPESCSTQCTDIRSDVWALGCSLYEIATGEPLFPVSRSGEATQVKMGSFNAILNWAQEEEKVFIDTKMFSGTYPTHRLCARWYELPAWFRKMVKSMLKTKIQDRPYPTQLLQSDYFVRTPQKQLHVESKKYDHSIAGFTRLYKFIRSIMNNETPKTVERAIRLYLRCHNSITKDIKTLAMACSMISIKLTHGSNFDLDEFVNKIIDSGIYGAEPETTSSPKAKSNLSNKDLTDHLLVLECKICDTLHYSLH